MTTLATKSMIAVAAVVLVGVAALSYSQARVAVSSAGSAPQAAADGAPINACALLTEAEISAAVGVKVLPGERRDEGEVGGKGEYASAGTYSSTCLWQFTEEDIEDPLEKALRDLDADQLPLGGKRFAILNAMVWPAGSGEAGKFLQSFRDAFKHEVIPSDPVPVNIGDEGLWWGDGVAARKGDKSFGISVFLQNGDKAAQRKMEENLARRIARRL
jgi:hypothetical protein